jgi:hypothetical protein
MTFTHGVDHSVVQKQFGLDGWIAALKVVQQRHYLMLTEGDRGVDA